MVFDIDYRPNLWGLAGHDAGFERYVKSDTVSSKLKAVLADCDLIIGTEEEIMIATGADSVLESLKAIRAITHGTIVLKRGAMGCIVYDGPISDDLEAGIVGKGFPIEVYNVLGAGDAFMSGFLRGWLRGEPLETCATWANACGAFAVSRLLCSPEYPTWPELDYFLTNGSSERALRKDVEINHLHWVTTRRQSYPMMMALALDHRSQLEELSADEATRARIPAFKVLAVAAAPRRPELVIGFAAETENMLEFAKQKRKRKGADWIVANDVSGDVMGGDRNRVTIVTGEGIEVLDDMPKAAVAMALVERIAASLTAEAAE